MITVIVYVKYNIIQHVYSLPYERKQLTHPKVSARNVFFSISQLLLVDPDLGKNNAKFSRVVSLVATSC